METVDNTSFEIPFADSNVTDGLRRQTSQCLLAFYDADQGSAGAGVRQETASKFGSDRLCRHGHMCLRLSIWVI